MYRLRLTNVFTKERGETVKRIWLIVSLLAAASVLAPAWGGSAAAKQVEAEREIRRLLDDWNNAYLQGDKAAFDRIVGDDWVITLSSGKVVEGAKADEISDLIPLDSSYVLRNDEVKLRHQNPEQSQRDLVLLLKAT